MDESQDTIQNEKVDADYSMDEELERLSIHPLTLESRIEGLLFVSTSPVGVGHLAIALDTTHRNIEAALEALDAQYLSRGIKLQKNREGYQLTSTPEIAADIERFFELESVTTLTRAALEVLSIVAYLQPVTRPQIDSIRGVNSDSSLRTLLRHGLIEEIGRSAGPGRPILYGSSPEFLQHFGLKSLEELPAIDLEMFAPIDDEEAGETTPDSNEEE